MLYKKLIFPEAEGGGEENILTFTFCFYCIFHTWEIKSLFMLSFEC
jgi:hypothetical protein